MNIVCLDVVQVSQNFAQLKPHLLRAIDRSRGLYTLAIVSQHIVDGGMQVWVLYTDENVIKGVGCTEILHREGRIVCSISLLAGGQITDWDKHFSVMEDFARENKCDYIEFQGRPGFTKINPKFVAKAYIYEIKLEKAKS